MDPKQQRDLEASIMKAWDRRHKDGSLRPVNREGDPMLIPDPKDRQNETRRITQLIVDLEREIRAWDRNNFDALAYQPFHAIRDVIVAQWYPLQVSLGKIDPVEPKGPLPICIDT